MAVMPATLRSTNRQIMVQAGHSVKRDPISKLTNTKRAGDVTEVADHLPSKHQALSLIPIPTKIFKKWNWVFSSCSCYLGVIFDRRKK
jgi:hypothetical protein